jgi:hypothetical protein
MFSLKKLIFGAFLLISSTPIGIFCQTALIGVGEAIFEENQNITLVEARQKALEKAREDILIQTQRVVANITTRYIAEHNQITYDDFANFTKEISRALITKEEIIEDPPLSYERLEGSDKFVYKKRVVLEAWLKEVKGEPDPAFQVVLKTDRSAYHQSEPLKMKVSSTKDCYITIFNLFANDSMKVIFPHQFHPDNFLKANTELSIPSATESWSLPLYLLPGREQDTEALLIIATKENILFNVAENLNTETFFSFPSALQNINRWLIEMAAEEYTQDLVKYVIVK